MKYRGDKTFLESKKARAFLMVLVSMNAIIGIMLTMGKSQEFLQLPFDVLSISVVGYLGSQMAPDVASAWSSPNRRKLSPEAPTEPDEEPG